jgi:hypothetical protein
LIISPLSTHPHLHSNKESNQIKTYQSLLLWTTAKIHIGFLLHNLCQFFFGIKKPQKGVSRAQFFTFSKKKYSFQPNTKNIFTQLEGNWNYLSHLQQKK